MAAVEARLACGETPAFLYVIPDGHNPLGISLSPEKRAALVELACRYRLLAALRRDLPQALLRNRPQAGLYVWADLPPDLDATELLRVAIVEHKVAFCPGIAFATPGRRDGSHAIRLSFGNLSCEQIEEAVRRLARAVDRLLTTQERAHRSVKHPYQEVQPC